jgi:hypothetical protein
MAETLFEEAKRCPRCTQPGELVDTRPAPNGNGTLHFFQCENERCKEYHERWIVQTMPDGTIPVDDNERTRMKRYPELTSGQLSSGLMQMEDLLQRDLREQNELK